MEETSNQSSLVNHAIKWGLILGGITIALTIILYAVDYTIMVEFKFLGIIMLVLIGTTIYAGIDYRKSVGGLLPYGKAFQHGILLLALCGLVGTAFTFLLYNVIDTELPQKLTDAAVENAQAMMEKFGTPEDKMEEALAKARVDTADRFTTLGMIKGYLFGLIFYAVLAAITSLIVKKNPPSEI